MEATAERPAVDATAGGGSGIGTLLFHVQTDPSLSQRMETALSVARACEAHLTCLHVTPIEAYVAFDSFGGLFVMNDVIKALDDEELKLRARLEEDLQTEDVTWDYIQVTGNVPTQIIRHAALTDMIIVGREPHRTDFVGSAIGLLGDLLHRSRTPLFIPGTSEKPVDLTGTAVIAWNCTHEAANAVRAAVGLLKLAENVQVVQVREPARDEAFTARRLLEYLSRHGIHADLQVESPIAEEGEAVAATLLAHAQRAGAGYIVMGGYNHSRIGEYLFGGVTRSLLEDCPLPLFMAH